MSDAERLAAIRKQVAVAVAAEKPAFRTHFSEDDFSGDSSNLDDVTQWAFDYGAEWGEHSKLVNEVAFLLAERDALRARIEAAPHGNDCDDDRSGGEGDENRACTCWKSAALDGDQPEPTEEEWSERVQAARARARAKGYDDAHDREQGPTHLLMWAQDYLRRKRVDDAGGLIDAALAVIVRPEANPSPLLAAVWDEGALAAFSTEYGLTHARSEFEGMKYLNPYRTESKTAGDQPEVVREAVMSTEAERLAAIRERLAGHLAGTTRAEMAEFAIHVAGDMAYLLSLVTEWEATAHRTRDALHALEARVEAAPHGGSCRSRFDEWTGKRHTYRKGPCDCWKSAALAKDQPEAVQS